MKDHVLGEQKPISFLSFKWLAPKSEQGRGNALWQSEVYDTASTVINRGAKTAHQEEKKSGSDNILSLPLQQNVL